MRWVRQSSDINFVHFLTKRYGVETMEKPIGLSSYRKFRESAKVSKDVSHAVDELLEPNRGKAKSKSTWTWKEPLREQCSYTECDLMTMIDCLSFCFRG